MGLSDSEANRIPCAGLPLRLPRQCFQWSHTECVIDRSVDWDANARVQHEPQTHSFRHSLRWGSAMPCQDFTPPDRSVEKCENQAKSSHFAIASAEHLQQHSQPSSLCRTVTISRSSLEGPLSAANPTSPTFRHHNPQTCLTTRLRRTSARRPRSTRSVRSPFRLETTRTPEADD